MSEVACVPQDNIGSIDRFTVDVFGKLNLGVGWAAANDGDAVIQLVTVVSQAPDVGDAIGIGSSIAQTRINSVSAMGIAVHHSPAPGKDRAFSLCFSDNWRPLWAPREEEPLLLDDISTGAIDIEVKTPIDMVLMRHAGARVARTGEAESGPDGAVVPQSPVRDIAIPPRLHFTHQPKLTVVVPQRDALKVACVRSGLEDRGWRLGAQPPAGSHRISAHSEERSFLILPIPVSHPVVVEDIENRHMGPPQAEPATVTDVPKLHP